MLTMNNLFPAIYRRGRIALLHHKGDVCQRLEKVPKQGLWNPALLLLVTLNEVSRIALIAIVKIQTVSLGSVVKRVCEYSGDVLTISFAKSSLEGIFHRLSAVAALSWRDVPPSFVFPGMVISIFAQVGVLYYQPSLNVRVPVNLNSDICLVSAIANVPHSMPRIAK